MNGSTKRSTITILSAISLMMLPSCATLGTGKPGHCMTKAEFPNYAAVAKSKRAIHRPDLNGVPTKHVEYAARVAQLEGRCKGINALRDE